MNDTTPPNGTPGASPGGDSPHSGDAHRTDPVGGEHTPRTSDRFFSWLRSLGLIRGKERWFAGVAGSIADKAGIDPLIVRGVFVVLALLGGPGVLLYLAGWLLLPDYSGRIHAEEIWRGRSSAGAITAAVILGAIILIPIITGLIFGLLPALFNGVFGWNNWGVVPEWLSVTFTVIWWALILPALIIWAIVWISRGGLSRLGARPGPSTPGAPPRGAASTVPGAPGPATFAAGTSGPAQSFSGQAPSAADSWGEGDRRRAESWGEDFSQKAENWGQKVSDTAEEWGRTVEEKSQEWTRNIEQDHEARRLDAGHVVITLACALLAAGAVAAWALTMSLSASTALIAGLIAAVAVLGMSSIVAGVRGRNTGWVGFLSFVGVIALIFAPLSALGPQNTEFVPFGQVNTYPSDQGDDRGLIMLAGNSTVDLNDLTSAASPRTIEVWVLAGNVTVRLPDSAPTRVDVRLGAGNVRDQRLDNRDERRQGGIFMGRVIESNTAGFAGAEITQVRVNLLAGNVRVEGGSSGPSSSQPQTPGQQTEAERLEQQQQEIEHRLAEIQRAQDSLDDLERERERLEELQRELENAQ